MSGAPFRALLAISSWIAAALTPGPSAQAAIMATMVKQGIGSALSKLCLNIFDEKDKLIPLDPQPESLVGLRLLVRYTTGGGAHHGIAGTILAESEESITLISSWGESFEIHKARIRTLALLADRKLPRAED